MDWSHQTSAIKMTHRARPRRRKAYEVVVSNTSKWSFQNPGGDSKCLYLFHLLYVLQMHYSILRHQNLNSSRLKSHALWGMVKLRTVPWVQGVRYKQYIGYNKESTLGTWPFGIAIICGCSGIALNHIMAGRYGKIVGIVHCSPNPKYDHSIETHEHLYQFKNNSHTFLKISLTKERLIHQIIKLLFGIWKLLMNRGVAVAVAVAVAVVEVEEEEEEVVVVVVVRSPVWYRCPHNRTLYRTHVPHERTLYRTHVPHERTLYQAYVPHDRTPYQHDRTLYQTHVPPWPYPVPGICTHVSVPRRICS